MIAQRQVQPLSIVEHFDGAEQLLSGFLACGGKAVAEVIKALGLDGGPKALPGSMIIFGAGTSPGFASGGVLGSWKCAGHAHVRPAPGAHYPKLRDCPQ